MAPRCDGLSRRPNEWRIVNHVRFGLKRKLVNRNTARAGRGLPAFLDMRNTRASGNEKAAIDAARAGPMRFRRISRLRGDLPFAGRSFRRRSHQKPDRPALARFKPEERIIGHGAQRLGHTKAGHHGGAGAGVLHFGDNPCPRRAFARC